MCSLLINPIIKFTGGTRQRVPYFPFLEETGRSNGMAFDKNGYLIACADTYGEVWKIAPHGSHEVLVNNYNSKMLNGPNDVWINPVTGAGRQGNFDRNECAGC
jgi:sugar lactone lactonase YvrE